MKYVILVLTLMSLPAFGDPDEGMHAAAHIGTSFALQTTFYGINKELGLTKPRAEAVAYVETMLLGFMYKANQGIPNDTSKAVFYNAVGAGLAIGVHYTFEF